MGAATVVTLIGVAIGVAAIALYLIVIAALLNRVSFTVGTILIGVRSIATQCEPVESVVNKISENVDAVDQAMQRLVGEPAPRQIAIGAGLEPGRRRGARRA